MYLFMIACYFLMAINVISLALYCLMGYFRFYFLGANYYEFALFAMIVFIFTETLVMYFFIATSKSLKVMLEGIIENNIYWKKISTVKTSAYSQVMMTILVFGGAFLHGGAVDNNMSIALLHSPLCLLAFVHHIYTITSKNNLFKQQVEIAEIIIKLKS